MGNFRLTFRNLFCVAAMLTMVVGQADAASVTALQGLNGNTLVAGKTTAFRMYIEGSLFDSVQTVVTTIVRPDGTTLTQHWTPQSFVSIPTGSLGPSIVVRVAGKDLPWIGAYGFSGRALNSNGSTVATFSLPSLQLSPTKDLIVGVDRLWANDINPGTTNEVQAANDALTRLAAIWPVRDGISQPDGDKTAGLRYTINNNPKGPPAQDSQLCPFLNSLFATPPGSDVLNLGIAYRFQDSKEDGGGTAPHFCDPKVPPVGWVFLVMSGVIGPGFGQESGHVFGLEPDNDPHFDHDPKIQAMHSKDVTIATLDSELGFDIQANRGFSSPTFDVMHQEVCGCPNDQIAYNTWDWEFLRKHFLTFASTGPTNPAHFSTDATPAVAGVGPDVYFVAKRNDGRLFYNRAALGAAGDGYKEMEGNGLSLSAPSAAAVGTHLFVGIRGQDQNVYVNQADDRQSFGNWQSLNFRTNAAPGLAAVGNSIFIFAQGLDQKIFLNQAVLGHSFSGWFEVQGNGRTDAAPVAAAVGNHIFVAIKGLDGKLYMNQADFGHAFGQWLPLNFSSDVPPALTAVNQTIFFFAKSGDHRIFVNQAVVGHAGSGWFEVQGGGRTDAAPASGSVANHLFVAVKGTDNRLLINQADFGHAFGEWFP